MQTKYFGIPFAALGDKQEVPNAQQVDGSVSYSQGFGPDYEKDLDTEADAKPVPRDATNQLYFDLTGSVGALQQEGAPQFIDPADNGGVAFAYARGARVRYGSPLRTFISRIDTNTSLPTVATDWQPELFEAATNADAIAGTGTGIVTPPALQAALAAASIAVPDASTTVKGIQRNATNAEAVAGTLTSATVTPAGLAAAVASMVPAASTTVAGRSRLATVAEAAAASSAVLAVTPAGLLQTKEIAWVNGLQTALNAKANLAGTNRFTGIMQVGTTGQPFASISNGGGGIYWSTNRADGSLPDAPAFYRAGSHTWTNGSGSMIAYLNGDNGNLSINGQVVPAGGFQNGSSRTVKDHVTNLDAEQSLARVLALQGVTYRYHGSDKERLGYYAEDVQEVIPHAVSEGDKGCFSPLLLEDAQMLPDHTGAIQALYARLEKALSRIAELEAAR